VLALPRAWGIGLVFRARIITGLGDGRRAVTMGLVVEFRAVLSYRDRLHSPWNKLAARNACGRIGWRGGIRLGGQGNRC